MRKKVKIMTNKKGAGIDKNAIVSLTKKFVSINTSNPPGKEERLANVLERLFRQLGFKTQRIELIPGRANIIATLGEGKKTLIFIAHMDTVPAGEGWKNNPFSGIVIGNKIYGRGATDMKGCIASMVEAVASLRREGWKPKGTLKFAFCVNEEMGDAEKIGMQAIIPRIGSPKDSLVVMGDTSDFKITVAEKGVLWLELICYGREAHASMPWTAINALEKLNKVIYHLNQEKIEGEHKLLGKSTISTTVMNAGIKTNIIPGIAKAQLDIRIIPGKKKEEVIDIIKRVINRLKKEDRDINVEIKEIMYYPPVESRAAPSTIDMLKNIISSYGKEPVVIGEHGATGAGFFVHAGFPTIVFGPGKPENCHIKDEYIEIDDLIKATQIYREFIKKYLS